MASTSAHDSAPGTTAGISTSDLQRAMAMFQGGQEQQRTSISILLSAENVSPILMDQDVQNELVPLLPESQQTLQELEQTLRSPQLRQGIASLGSALHTGNFNAIMSNFGLDHMAGANQLAMGDAVGAFLAAIQDWSDRSMVE